MTQSARQVWLCAMAGLAIILTVSTHPAPAQEPGAAAPGVELVVPEDAEPLTRGPLHEAFAEQTTHEPAVGTSVPRKPPEPIDEVPPDVKPEGEDIHWIPGYWHWDEDRQDFIWVSGTWRKVPPGRTWVPGRWADWDGGYRWIPGLWARGGANSLEYKPDPPQSLEAGPPSIAPGNDYFWVPGCWLHGTSGYRWRPGYWQRSHGQFVWTPSYYVWSPRGCVYVDGYWDFPFNRRGIPFCPVYFRAYDHPRNIRYSPHVALNATGIFYHLFVRSGCNHYYFGDYYGQRHGRYSYRPWYDFHRVGRRYDPFHARLGTISRRHGIDYTNRYRDWHHYFAKGEQRRPPRTYAAQSGFANRHKNTPHYANTVVARRLNDLAADRNSNQRFVRLGEQAHRDVSRRVRELQQHGARRVGLESQQRRQSAVANSTSPGRITPQVRRSQPPRTEPGLRPRGNATSHDDRARDRANRLRELTSDRARERANRLRGLTNSQPERARDLVNRRRTDALPTPRGQAARQGDRSRLLDTEPEFRPRGDSTSRANSARDRADRLRELTNDRAQERANRLRELSNSLNQRTRDRASVQPRSRSDPPARRHGSGNPPTPRLSVPRPSMARGAPNRTSAGRTQPNARFSNPAARSNAAPRGPSSATRSRTNMPGARNAPQISRFRSSPPTPAARQNSPRSRSATSGAFGRAQGRSRSFAPSGSTGRQPRSSSSRGSRDAGNNRGRSGARAR